jgi:putative transposase
MSWPDSTIIAPVTAYHQRSCVETYSRYITGTVDQELLLRNEYLVTENRMLRKQIKGRVQLSDGERKALAEIGQRLTKQALQEVVKIVKPDTILAWHRQLVAQKFDGSQQRKALGRPKVDTHGLTPVAL